MRALCLPACHAGKSWNCQEVQGGTPTLDRKMLFSGSEAIGGGAQKWESSQAGGPPKEAQGAGWRELTSVKQY